MLTTYYQKSVSFLSGLFCSVLALFSGKLFIRQDQVTTNHSRPTSSQCPSPTKSFSSPTVATKSPRIEFMGPAWVSWPSLTRERAHTHWPSPGHTRTQQLGGGISALRWWGLRVRERFLPEEGRDSITRKERVDIKQTKTSDVYYNRLLSRSQGRVPTEYSEWLSPNASCNQASWKVPVSQWGSMWTTEWLVAHLKNKDVRQSLWRHALAQFFHLAKDVLSWAFVTLLPKMPLPSRKQNALSFNSVVFLDQMQTQSPLCLPRSHQGPTHEWINEWENESKYPSLTTAVLRSKALGYREQRWSWRNPTSLSLWKLLDSAVLIYPGAFIFSSSWTSPEYGTRNWKKQSSF